MKLIPVVILLIGCNLAHGQGYNHQWLLGNYNFVQDPKGRMFIDSNNFTIIPETRKMPFYGAQGNICDANGNLLMSSNGVWIADATNDTMVNGSDINPGIYASNWPNGFPISNTSLFLPYPADTNQFLLIHQTGGYNGFAPVMPSELYYSLIDITQNSGLGVVTLKNQVIYQDTIAWGVAACKHSNGRDWWVVTVKDSSDQVYITEITPGGIQNTSLQTLGFSPISIETISQLTFSPDGTKFIASTYDDPINRNSFIVIADFNRCSGTFSNTQTIQLTSGSYLWGQSFSPSGTFAYACNSNHIFQINTNTYTFDTVATYDGFISPGPSCCATTFGNMYLAANGKIYITSGSSIRHFTEINNPDSAGIACDIQQHSVFIGNYAHLRSVPNHPNYYLGCDTSSGCPCLTSDEMETSENDFRFMVSPNPTSGPLKFVYLLPLNKNGILEIYDVKGIKVYSQNLPPWSTFQHVNLTFLKNGIYHCVITSGNDRFAKNFVIIGE
ncbi:MAG: T9SS type A sorting domain-containing protein [Bacteroidota bacterium]|nr:T9SS type A sorting domain-containing protein [Bacteroidota bacterium]